MSKTFWTLLIVGSLYIFAACGTKSPVSANLSNKSEPLPDVSLTKSNQTVSADSEPTPTPFPIETTNSPIGKFDFKNHTYPLPRGWQGEVGEITLTNGKAPLSLEEDKRKIGASFVRTKYGDVTGDGQDEAFVIVKIETGGSALPQVVYIFKWESGKPVLIWSFRTGDRADGGLRDVFAANGELVVELYGQDRYIFADVETLKIVGDEQQLCCPTHFTRNRYKFVNGRFVLQGKRLTYSVAEPNAPPVENMGDKIANQLKKN